MMQEIKKVSSLLLIPFTVGGFTSFLSPGNWFSGWMAASLLLFLSISFLYLAWAYTGKSRAAAWMAALAFGLRLIFGMGLGVTLPVLGYPEPCQQAGYVFKDACRRDQEAFSLARSDAVLLPTSQLSLSSDQYGGLALVSAWVYRYLSPDAHRPFLVLILGISVYVIGLFFFYQAICACWSEGIASIAGLIYALYPDGIFFTVSQMREPFLIGLSGVAIWSICTWRQGWRTRLAILLSGLAVMAFFSSKVALMIAGYLAVWLWLEVLSSQCRPRYQRLGWVGLGIGMLLVGGMTWEWFGSSTHWDMIVSVRSSGWIQEIIRQIGEEWTWPIITLYGIAQPVLPAAIVDDANPLWKGIAIFRSTGWYLLAPFLLYGGLMLWKEPNSRRKRTLAWLALVVFSWILISSLRAGGDAVDNPRYRSLILPWMALMAGWAVNWMMTQKDWAFLKYLIVETIFLGFITFWYMGRYYPGIRLPFWTAIGWITGMSTLVLLIGAWMEAGRRKIVPERGILRK